MKFKDERPFASVNAGVQKLLEIANAMEADHAGRLISDLSTGSSSRPAPAFPNMRQQ
jgi:hypothetical protein